MIDLHSHTLHSDGQRSPEELLSEAEQVGVKVLSLTDHDTVSGIADASETAVALRCKTNWWKPARRRIPTITASAITVPCR